MDIATLAGLVLGIIIIGIVLIMDGGSPAELFAHPSAIILIWGGSLAATAVTTSLKGFLKLPKLIVISAKDKKLPVEESIETLVSLADKARRDGLLALEEDSKKISDPFLRKGLMMIVDGIDPEQVHAILETTIEQTAARHRSSYGLFTAAGGFAPTFGIIGTVMGLISVLKKLDNPDELAKSIAGAFLATLWGLLSANLVFLPLGAKLKAKSEEELHLREMQLKGIMAIQAGENPRIVREKLSAFVAPGKAKGEKADGKAGQPAAAKAKA